MTPDLTDNNWPNPCACLGPIDGEPCCPCTMVRCGLPRSEEHKRKQDEATTKIKQVFDSIFKEAK